MVTTHGEDEGGDVDGTNDVEADVPVTSRPMDRPADGTETVGTELFTYGNGSQLVICDADNPRAWICSDEFAVLHEMR